MNTIIEVIMAITPIIGTAVLCWWDPAGLADAKYGPKEKP
jgi:hypothetical protein